MLNANLGCSQTIRTIPLLWQVIILTARNLFKQGFLENWRLAMGIKMSGGILAGSEATPTRD
jgi:hypothetical protein